MEITSSNPGTYPIAEWGLSAAGDRKVKFRLGGTHPLHAAAHFALLCFPPMTSAARKNPHHEAAQAERKINFDGEQMVMQIFCDNAKTYVQLGGAALAFDAIIFWSNSYIPKTGNLADPCNFTMWICFLAAVVVGAFYQYQAVKYLEG